MDIKAILRLMPNLWASRDLLLYLMSVTVLGIIFFMAFGKLGFAYSEAETIRQEIETKTAFVNEWRVKAREVKAHESRPVAAKDIDRVQENVLLLLTGNDLELTSFRNLNNNTQKDNGQDFEMIFYGSWKSTVALLVQLDGSRALMAIKDLKMEPDRAMGVTTTMQYKIYIK